jgi:HK97 family phage prohead protease
MPSQRTEIRARRTLERRALTQAEKDAGLIGVIRSIIPYASDSGEIRDEDTNDGKPFVEQIAQGAFKRSLEAPGDIMAFVGHTDDPLASLGRAGAGLTFTETDAGLEWEALVPDTTACRDLIKLIDREVIKASSFEFSVRTGGEKWEKRGPTDIRIITDAKLYAVNPVAWPAYPDSSLTVAMRSRSKREVSAYSTPDYYSSKQDDVGFAESALARELNDFGAAQRYLRDNPAGAHVAYATKSVEECAAEIKALLDWLSANGITPDAETMTRAAKATTDKREQTPAAPTFTDRALWAARFGL